MYRRTITLVVLIMLPFLNFNCIDDIGENCPSWKKKNIEFLVRKLLSSDNVEHRACAALTLGGIGEPAAKRGVPALIQALTDEH